MGEDITYFTIMKIDFAKLLPEVKLKHLGKLTQEKLDVQEIMTDVVGYKNHWWMRPFNFMSKFKAAYLVSQAIRSIDLAKLELPKEPKVKVPKNIDFISFQAMMELQATMSNATEESDVIDVVAQIICIATFSENFDIDYDSDSKEFKNYKEQILNTELINMFGVYNWICKAVEESANMWNERFLSVQILDEDYEQAGGSRMAQFNVITTIKTICSDFNLPFKDAWQMSYNLIQTNSYAKATQNHIKDNMRVLKETKMKAARAGQQQV